MIIKEISVSKNFIKRFKKLPRNIRDIADVKVDVFRKNPFHNSLRLHRLNGELEGLWSISIDKKNRIIFKVKDENIIIFISIGKHDIYKNL